MFIRRNPNPLGKSVGDCVIRAISIAFNIPWEDAYVDLADQGFTKCDMPSSNDVWSSYLLDNGFRRKIIPDTCPDCYTIHDFCQDHPRGLYIVATGSHVVAVIDGDYYDSWDSGNEVPIYYFERR